MTHRLRNAVLSSQALVGVLLTIASQESHLPPVARKVPLGAHSYTAYRKSTLESHSPGAQGFITTGWQVLFWG